MYVFFMACGVAINSVWAYSNYPNDMSLCIINVVCTVCCIAALVIHDHNGEEL